MIAGALLTAAPPAIGISADRTNLLEGETVSITASGAKPGSLVHCRLNGSDWGAEFRVADSGVAHLVVPIPDVGTDKVQVTDGTTTSEPVSLVVVPRQFRRKADRDHTIVLEYETWFGPGYAAWGREEAVPLLGHYSSLDPRVARQHALWFEDLGIDTVELDWTNNLTTVFPSPAANECIAATDVLLDTYATMPQHPLVMFLLGPEHNAWNGPQDTYAGPWFQAQLDYLWARYFTNPKYRGMFQTYLGKPLLTLYLNGPRSCPPPAVNDNRFTIRYVGAWLQTTHQEQYGVWSWYDQQPTPTDFQGKPEALTVTDGYPSPVASVPGFDNWLSPGAGAKDEGRTYLDQWDVALRTRPRFLFICQWNEFEPNDQWSANLSNDLEPTILTDPKDPRPSGWGFGYYRLTKDLIDRYRLGKPDDRYGYEGRSLFR